VANSLAKCACQALYRSIHAARLTALCRYWGTSETLLPVYQSVDKAIGKHSEVDTVVNFASSRSVYTSTMELLEFPQIKCIAIIAEGVPERVSAGVV
jgi:succinyl-CoA synthetase alpha subunit